MQIHDGKLCLGVISWITNLLHFLMRTRTARGKVTVCLFVPLSTGWEGRVNTWFPPRLCHGPAEAPVTSGLGPGSLGPWSQGALLGYFLMGRKRGRETRKKGGRGFLSSLKVFLLSFVVNCLLRSQAISDLICGDNYGIYWITTPERHSM